MPVPHLSRRGMLLLVGGALPLAARKSAKNPSFWQTKEPSEWSEQEIDRLITDSPWAREVATCATTGRGRPAQIGAIVRWESARPVLAALDTTLPTAFEDRYVISVNGILPRRSTDELDEALEDVKRTTFLRSGAGFSAAPDIVRRMPSRNTINLLFGFPYDDRGLTLDDAEASFGTEVTGCSIRTTFRLAEMVYQGELAL